VPLQNRVTPFGTIERSPARGMFTGNRGCLHDANKQLVREYQVRRWIICVLEFKGRRAELMRPGYYTHLFFLDEATALAAGHRPCAECQRERFNDFRGHWAAANPDVAGGSAPRADLIDSVLHQERVAGGRARAARRKVTYQERLGNLPDGAFVTLADAGPALLVLGGRVYPWSHAGYGDPIALSADTVVSVLTPRSTVRALAHGYTPVIAPVP